MAVDLPALPKPAQVRPFLVDFGGQLEPPLGAAVQEVLRFGNRFGVEVGLPPLTGACAEAWICARLAAKTLGGGLVLAMPQLVGAPSGLSASGALGASSVTISGGTAVKGMWFSFAAGGRNYLHKVVAVSGSTATIAPRLRAAVSGSIETAAPKLEGLLPTGEQDWSIERMRFVGQGFTLTEQA